VPLLLILWAGSFFVFNFNYLFQLGMPAGGDTFFAFAQKKYPKGVLCKGVDVINPLLKQQSKRLICSDTNALWGGR